jgi:hypothetical protein
MKHLVFNSFPRSGNVFLSNISSQAFSMQMSAVHLYEIFGVEDLLHVSIFRKPSDAIASLVNKLREHSNFSERAGQLDIEIPVLRAVETYDKYINAVSKNIGNVHVVLFENLEKDYRPVIQDISDRFSLSINAGYEDRIDLDGSSPIWANKYDGHAPREKDDIRLRIEGQVSAMESVQKLNERYHDFLNKI